MIRLAWVAATTLLLAQAVVAASNAPRRQADCLDTTTAAEINRLFRLGGADKEIALCPLALVIVDPHKEPIKFTAPRQSLYTLGLPKDSRRATIVIENSDGRHTGDLTTAIDATCQKCQRVSIRSLHVDGGQSHLGQVEGGEALIRIGGKAGNGQLLQYVEAFGARGYAVIHAASGGGSCHNVTILDNTVHSSGNAPLDAFLTSDLARLRDGPAPYDGLERPGTWTDGISLACYNSIVSANVVKDVSGVGIALRGSAGAQVHHNTVVADDRDMLVGISIVANPHASVDAAHQRAIYVRENRIHAGQAMIRVGLSTGSGTWSTDELPGRHQIPYESSIVHNRFTSMNGYYGYAMALSDATGLQILENAISASIWGSETNACLAHPGFVPPTPLIRDPRSVTFAPDPETGDFQPSFVDRHFGFLLCVGPGSGSSSTELARHSIGPQHGEVQGLTGVDTGLLLQQMHPSIPAPEARSGGSRRNTMRQTIRRGKKKLETHIAPDGSEFAIAKKALRQVDRTLVQQKAQKHFGMRPQSPTLPRPPRPAPHHPPPVVEKPPHVEPEPRDEAAVAGLPATSGEPSSPQQEEPKIELAKPEKPPLPPSFRETKPPFAKPLPPLGMRKSRRGLSGAIEESSHKHHHPYEAIKRRGGSGHGFFGRY
ncbi:hypothetical protein JCM10908_000930 [Rhodotorula pacifica]|uniref:uncharacterized protein n=1 Tax=Rhodotorula pacifica TaxID=1495444 RepID=UPI00317C4F72